MGKSAMRTKAVIGFNREANLARLHGLPLEAGSVRFQGFAMPQVNSRRMKAIRGPASSAEARTEIAHSRRT
jgi:hypothetical protein